MRDHDHCTTGGQHSGLPAPVPVRAHLLADRGAGVRAPVTRGTRGISEAHVRPVSGPGPAWPRKPAPSRRTYVLDTSVLLADPGALKRFEEHEVVLPVVVITELEGKRHHPELGYFARSALRMLDELRVQNGRLDEPVPVGDLGGTIRVELNHTDPESLPSGFRLGDNDTRILAVARNLANEGREVILISKDLPLRIKASAVGLDAAEYRGEQSTSPTPAGPA